MVKSSSSLKSNSIGSSLRPIGDTFLGIWVGAGARPIGDTFLGIWVGAGAGTRDRGGRTVVVESDGVVDVNFRFFRASRS